LLTRNIKIQASADAEQSFFGGHIMAMPSSHMYVEGVELRRMGQNLTLARYPMHWHLVGDAKGQYIKNAAIHVARMPVYAEGLGPGPGGGRAGRQIAAEADATREHLLFRVEPAKSHVSDAFGAADPEFWRTAIVSR
jgi:hypothetical protein